MRLALRHQIILAPAVVLFLMTLLLGFLQYTYWDLSVKRQEARNLRDTFIALAEADLSIQRMHGLALQLSREPVVGGQEVALMQELYQRLDWAITQVLDLMALSGEIRSLLQKTIADLDPGRGLNPEDYIRALSVLRPQLVSLVELTQKQRDRVRDVHNQDIDVLVARTTFVSIVVLGAAILLGVFLSLYFSRRILKRIHTLSSAAGRIARGDLSPPAPPDAVRDELDDLCLSINRMTERLIQVVGTEKLLEGAEDERRRIAMDIHDQTLSDLGSVLRGLQGFEGRNPDDSQIRELEGELQRSIGNLREIMDNLHPQALEILGLGAALQSHLERHLDLDDLPEYHFYSSADVETASLSSPQKLALYRIALEAIHNVIKHARAGRYEVNLSRRGEDILLSVEDNGRGFEFSRVGRFGGRGLNNIRRRAAAIGAEVSWRTSRFSSGTRFELTLPLAQEVNGEK